jgi:hypothetical protein
MVQGEKHGERESIAQRSRRLQRGIGLVAKVGQLNTVASARETRESGKHRTEATEVTEGIGLVAKVGQ